MKKLTQSNIIKKMLQDNPDKWFFSHELVKVNTKWGWLGTASSRRARELAESGEIDVRNEGKFAEYHFKSSLYKKVQYTLADGRVLNFVEKK